MVIGKLFRKNGGKGEERKITKFCLGIKPSTDLINQTPTKNAVGVSFMKPENIISSSAYRAQQLLFLFRRLS